MLYRRSASSSLSARYSIRNAIANASTQRDEEEEKLLYSNPMSYVYILLLNQLFSRHCRFPALG